MARSEADPEKHSPPATREDITDVLGAVDDGKIVAILAMEPTIRDVEEASVWLSGDADVFGPGRPLKGVASQIVTLLTADEEEEPSSAR